LERVKLSLICPELRDEWDLMFERNWARNRERSGWYCPGCAQRWDEEDRPERCDQVPVGTSRFGRCGDPLIEYGSPEDEGHLRQMAAWYRQCDVDNREKLEGQEKRRRERERAREERHAEEEREREASRPRNKLHDLGDELRKGIPQADWVGLRGRYSRGAITCTGGYTGAGKTPLLLGESRAILAGEDFAGFSRVLSSVGDGFKLAYLTQETSATFLPAVYRAGITEDLASGRMKVGYYHDFATDDWGELVEDMTDYLAGDGLLLVDTAADWSRVRDENDNAAYAEALRPLQVAVGTNIAVGFVAHTVKSFVSVPDADARRLSEIS
jgi:AAA domain